MDEWLWFCGILSKQWLYHVLSSLVLMRKANGGYMLVG